MSCSIDETCRCGARLLFGISTGRTGARYEYSFCAGRHPGRSACDLPYLPLEQVEAVRDILMNLPKAADTPVNRSYRAATTGGK